jgi:hypothetical protein
LLPEFEVRCDVAVSEGTVADDLELERYSLYSNPFHFSQSRPPSYDCNTPKTYQDLEEDNIPKQEPNRMSNVDSFAKPELQFRRRAISLASLVLVVPCVIAMTSALSRKKRSEEGLLFRRSLFTKGGSNDTPTASPTHAPSSSPSKSTEPSGIPSNVPSAAPSSPRVIDQSNEGPYDIYAMDLGYVGQSFQAGITGPMARIDFATAPNCGTNGNGPRDATLFIYEGEAFGTLPNPVHNQSVALTQGPCKTSNSFYWSEFVLSPPVNVLNGTSYTFMVDPTDNNEVFRIPLTAGSSYERGRAYYADPVPESDVFFRTLF